MSSPEQETYSSDPGASVPPIQREYFCKYCDTKSVLTPTGGDALVCPVCGAPVSQSDIDALHDDAYEELAAYRASTLPSDRSSKRSSSIVSKVMFFAVLMVIIAFVTLPDSDSSRSSSENNSAYTRSTEDSIYVPALSRTVNWYAEYDSYYDEQTDCYFLLNTDMDPEIWQYWYEGISSDYGDYGWMEWDEKENRWYINTNADDWEPLPEKYDTSGLWHF